MYLGIDVGGTSTRIALFQTSATAQFIQIARFPTLQDYAQQMHAIMTAIEQSEWRDFAGIGVSIGGRMARDGRSVLVAPNLPEYVGKPFVDDLAQQFGCPVRLAHDTV